MANIRQSRNDIPGWFEAVVNNGILFLNSSVENLSNSPKSSLIDLYTAIELFFKARLMKEHWSLILSKPENAVKGKFENGDFHSVYLEQAHTRLKNICEDNISNEAMNNFKALGEHRNQIVHFAHTGFSGNETEVIIEHWASWFHLHKILTEQWADIFTNYQDLIDKIHQKVKKNHSFLSAKFEFIKHDINNTKNQGHAIVKCSSCELLSAKIIKSYAWGGQDIEYLVCDVKELKLKEILTPIPCPHCGQKEVAYFSSKDHKCSECKMMLSFQYALKQYTEIYLKEDPESRYEDMKEPIAYCHECRLDEPTVINLENMWICVKCEDRGWTAMDCNNCFSFVTGDVNRVEHFACHRCEDEVIKANEEELEDYLSELEKEI